mmetsp:Transcript_43375/g.52559  ORF Transcript_43375/g.52559 Transcript_43375/m.52559 type:complete len:365 (+) Transcript_43375:120-1214(+)|eukprot:CAMPEP_0172490984 /NCGR_PEP_ID=MMETSP1066-20121228/21635_1 /TAXON_ID=671091 /ORGANISM="Coscinodiscus wailesii, Strain CCMP2513" /LENGTH=364 /DNA_ID=CAMNT_0013259755 /DNA_START=113 /DNA_END=1207 /DNA_ORIENTATION=+
MKHKHDQRSNQAISPTLSSVIQNTTHRLIVAVILCLAISTSSAAPSFSTRTVSNIKTTTAAAAAATTSPQPLKRIRQPLDAFCRTVVAARRHLAAAGVARCVSIFTMYPVDTIKTRMQLGQKVNLDGLYKGVGGSLFGQVPYGILTFGSYEMYKELLLNKFPSVKPVFIYAVSAIMGDVTGSGWLCPSEVIKQQLQAGMHASTFGAVADVWRKNGIRGFYEGYTGGLARDIPFRVAQLTSYEVTKNLYLRMKERRRKDKGGGDDDAAAAGGKLELSPADAAICGAIAGTFSSAVTSPLDRIKTMLMTNSAANGGSVFACAAKIWREEGIRGLCTGMAPRVVYIAPSVAIFFIAYEQVQQRLKDF